jgi:K(+)-stimulated pyrophosphate-energized sodium pump
MAGIDIYNAKVLASLFVGAMIPFIFSSLAIRAVGEAAMAMVEEVRRQFRTIPGIMEGTGKPEYDKCVAISTEASIKKMMLPGAIAILSPLIIGFILGPEALGGFLAGATVSGVLMGMFQNNAGGAWDNAKKSFEKGVEINGQIYKKGSDPHKAAVTGDTVGDPFKDTSGPSMNILIKLMSIVSLVVAPSLAQIHKGDSSHARVEKKVEIKISQNNSGENKIVVKGDDDLKDFIEALKKDNFMENGRLDVELSNGELTINGKKQPKDILEKYDGLVDTKKDVKISIKIDEK